MEESLAVGWVKVKMRNTLSGFGFNFNFTLIQVNFLELGELVSVLG